MELLWSNAFAVTAMGSVSREQRPLLCFPIRFQSQTTSVWTSWQHSSGSIYHLCSSFSSAPDHKDVLWTCSGTRGDTAGPPFTLQMKGKGQYYHGLWMNLKRWYIFLLGLVNAFINKRQQLFYHSLSISTNENIGAGLRPCASQCPGS